MVNCLSIVNKSEMLTGEFPMGLCSWESEDQEQHRSLLELCRDRPKGDQFQRLYLEKWTNGYSYDFLSTSLQQICKGVEHRVIPSY